MMINAALQILVLLFYWQTTAIYCPEQRNDKLSSDDMKVDNIMHELFGACFTSNPNMTLNELLKDTKYLSNDVNIYKEIVNTNKKLKEEIQWIVTESNNPKEISRFITMLKRNVGRECKDHTDYSKIVYGSCSDVKRKKSGIYKIKPDNGTMFEAYCDMDVDGGGWTVIQRREDGSTNFQRTWKEYAEGFGDLKNEFWIGNEKIHRLTTNGKHELRIDLKDWDGKHWYADYKTFNVGNAVSKYKLTVGNYTGTAGDGMAFHNSMRFTTKDQDNDGHYLYNCSRRSGFGGWWYNGCYRANLNGIYGKKSIEIKCCMVPDKTFLPLEVLANDGSPN